MNTGVKMMDEGKSQKATKFIDAVDKDLRESILRLDQKLKGLQAEVLVKLDSIGDRNDANERQRERAFTLLSEELSKAIGGVKRLVSIVISKDLSDKEFVQKNHENIEEMREALTAQLDELSKLKEQF